MSERRRYRARIKINTKILNNRLPNHILYVVSIKTVGKIKINRLVMNIKFVGNLNPLSKEIWIIKENNMKLKNMIGLEPKADINFYFSGEKNKFSQLVVNNKFVCTYKR